MNASAEKRPTMAVDKKQNADEVISLRSDTPDSTIVLKEKNNFGNLRDAIKALDAERAELVKNTIENIKPGKPFDSSVIRDINKLETRKNRLIVTLFASLLKKSGPEVQAIVHQIIEL